MNPKVLVTAAAVLSAALTPASAQTGQNEQGVRDILNRAQSQSDRKAVEDLIGKLQRAPARTTTPPADNMAPGPAPAPAAAATPQASPQTPPQAATSETATPSPAPTAPAAPAIVTTPAPAAPSAPATVASPGPASPASTPPAPETIPASPPAAATAPAPDTTAQPAAVTVAPPVAAPSPVATPPAPAAQPPAPIPASTPATRPVGTPIGPADALPGNVGPSEAEMKRAPDIAREQQLPNVDIEVLFAFNSAEVTPSAAQSLTTLGRALSDPRLAGQRFVIAGHTDARGGRAFNQELSERRAQSVRTFLIENFRITPDHLVARGYGETRLKNPRNPRAAENRRVQVINWTRPTAEQDRR